jgi:osmotically inducible lipoprotein OsmB
LIAVRFIDTRSKERYVMRMHVAFTAGLIVLSLSSVTSVSAEAGTLEGAGIGAGVGAVVLGPVGAVAGGVIGAKVGGPNIIRTGHHRRCWHNSRGYRHCR